ncbi:MAG TPA: DHHA1 domain-containing protein [Terriglobales bacterium]
MTERLYYHDSFLYEFDADVIESRARTDGESRRAIVLNRTAFYPTSGGQAFDMGWIVPAGNPDQKIRIEEVADGEDGRVLHFVGGEGDLAAGTSVHGLIDAERRRDHMQQHSGQHVLSAAFIRLFDMPTVSFHMGADYCSIDLDTKSLSSTQIEAAEALANDVVTQDRGVAIRFVTQEEAKNLGLRKIPPAEREKLRLIDIDDFDLTACGGTHVASTGQIGSILLRKTEKVRQGWRVEFVCGQRAVATARRDYTTLAEAAGILSGHIWEVPQQVRKLQEESRNSKKSREELLEEIADLHAAQLLASATMTGSRKVMVQTFGDRDLAFIKLLAQRLVRRGENVVALVGTTNAPAALVFAQSAGQPFDMNALMKETLAQLGGRGGGSKDMAQGGPEKTDQVGGVLGQLASRLQG